MSEKPNDPEPNLYYYLKSVNPLPEMLLSAFHGIGFRALPDSDYGFFDGESPSGGKEKPCTSTECPPGQLSGSFFECVTIVFDGNSLVTVPHPPYSPDLAPSDF
jgi:hypothetical protein